MVRVMRLGTAGRALAGLTRRVGGAALDMLLPPVCLTCDAPVAEQHQFCAACHAATAFIVPPLCDACGTPFGPAAAAPVCPSCALAPPPWRRARAAMRYDAQSRRVILPLKHADRPDLAPALAKLMARAGAALLDGAEVLVPVPLHRSRLAQRRYNQAALIACALGRLAGRPVLLDGLVRPHPTPPLGHLDGAQRAALVAGAFAVRATRTAAIGGRRVLLIDDVLTSGATAGGCAAALLGAGAASVDVLAAARVADRRLV